MNRVLLTGALGAIGIMCFGIPSHANAQNIPMFCEFMYGNAEGSVAVYTDTFVVVGYGKDLARLSDEWDKYIKAQYPNFSNYYHHCSYASNFPNYLRNYRNNPRVRMAHSNFQFVPSGASSVKPGTNSVKQGIERQPTPMTPAPHGYEYCYMMNERKYRKDMPVFTSDIFPYWDRIGISANNVRIEWNNYIESRSGFQGMIEGGCGHAATISAARKAQADEISGYLNSFAYAYLVETHWTYKP